MLRSVSGSTSSRGIAAVVGVGPRLGSAVARKFASEGYTVAILSRDLEKLSQLAEEIAQEAKAQVFALRVDCADARSVREAFEGVLSLGPVEVLVYNACEPPADGDGDASPRPTPFLAISPDAFHRALAVSAAGAFYCAHQVQSIVDLLNQSIHLDLLSIDRSRIHAGHPGDGRAGQGHRHLHRLVGVGHRIRRLLRSKLRQVCAERAVSVAGQGVPAGRRPHCSHDHRRRHRRTKVGEGEVRRRDDVDVGGGGPGRGGAELLARPRAGQERVDAGDGHPVSVADVVGGGTVELRRRRRRRCVVGRNLYCCQEGKGKRFHRVVVVCARLRTGHRVPVPHRMSFALRARAAWRLARLILSVWCIHPSIGSSRCPGKLPPKATSQLSLLLSHLIADDGELQKFM